MTESFQFLHPEFLFLLLFLPLLAIWKGRWGRPVAVRMPSTDDAVSVDYDFLSGIEGDNFRPDFNDQFWEILPGAVTPLKSRTFKGRVLFQAFDILFKRSYIAAERPVDTMAGN